MSAMPQQIVVTNGATSLDVSYYNTQNSATIILLHGGPGVPDAFLPLVALFKDEYNVITFDQRGLGNSVCGEKSYRMEDYIADINAIATHFSLDTFHLFGHSWGGLYAQIYAEKHPEKLQSLFLCSPSSGTNTVWKQCEKEVLSYNQQKATSKEWLRMGWYSLLGILGSDTNYRKLFKLVMHNYDKGYTTSPHDYSALDKISAEAINKTRKEISNYPLLSPMTLPDFPILITYGDDDIYGASQQEVQKRYPTSQYQVIERSGHIPWTHHLEAFTLLLTRFYKNIRQSS